MVRSTEVRKKYKDYDFPVRESVRQERGQVVIGNNLFGKYKGELQIILKEMPIDERKNIVGKFQRRELFLLDYVGAGHSFFGIGKIREDAIASSFFVEIVIYRI